MDAIEEVLNMTLYLVLLSASFLFISQLLFNKCFSTGHGARRSVVRKGEGGLVRLYTRLPTTPTITLPYPIFSTLQHSKNLEEIAMGNLQLVVERAMSHQGTIESNVAEKVECKCHSGEAATGQFFRGDNSDKGNVSMKSDEAEEVSRGGETAESEET